MTRPDHPRPEVVAARQALVIALWGRQVTADVAALADTILAHLPAPFAIVDMDAIRAAMEALLVYVPLPRNPDAGPQWMRNRAAKVTAAVAEARRLLEGGRT